jgi:hypothetical protein
MMIERVTTSAVEMNEKSAVLYGAKSSLDSLLIELLFPESDSVCMADCRVLRRTSADTRHTAEADD